MALRRLTGLVVMVCRRGGPFGGGVGKEPDVPVGVCPVGGVGDTTR